MGRLRPRRLRDLLLGPVAQASRPADLPADLGLAGRRACWPSPSAASPSSPTRPASGSRPMSSSISTAARPAPARFIAGLTAKEEVGLIIGWTARGLGGDRRDPRRLSLRSLAPARSARPALRQHALGRPADPARRLPVHHRRASPPSTGSIPFAHMFASAWVGAAVATLQDLVLPRMRATAGATYILGTTMVGLALGPYFAGKMSVLTGSLRDRHRRALLSCRRSPCSASGSAHATSPRSRPPRSSAPAPPANRSSRPTLGAEP